MKFLEFLDARSFGLQAAERRFEILKFLSARHFGLRATTRFLNFTPAPSRNGFRILKFTSKLSDGSEILKFMRALARLADIAQNFVSRNGFNVCEPLRALHRVLPNADKAEAGRAENFSKFDLTSALLNFISLPPRKFKLALLKFTREVSRNGFEILKFVPELNDGSEILKFTPRLRKFKPASAVRLNFALNSVPRACTAKFENGVKFKGVAKFKRGVQ